ncbi:cupredoxin domain-containing protein [Roseiterribacter gracilis]|uniref:cupredoxin domain-containing protein n=1 Tax=Roseiterribacter gracilis TaxID=2812848 RepID=UPI003B439546
MKRRTLLLAGAALVAGAATSKAADDTSGDKQVVVIDNHAYLPPDLEVKVGTVVQWVNQDGDEHDVTENKKAFRSPILDKGEEWKRLFDQPGTVEYYCSLHPHMIGKIRVV